MRVRPSAFAKELADACDARAWLPAAAASAPSRRALAPSPPLAAAASAKAADMASKNYFAQAPPSGAWPGPAETVRAALPAARRAGGLIAAGWRSPLDVLTQMMCSDKHREALLVKRGGGGGGGGRRGRAVAARPPPSFPRSSSPQYCGFDRAGWGAAFPTAAADWTSYYAAYMACADGPCACGGGGGAGDPGGARAPAARAPPTNATWITVDVRGSPATWRAAPAPAAAAATTPAATAAPPATATPDPPAADRSNPGDPAAGQLGPGATPTPMRATLQPAAPAATAAPPTPTPAATAAATPARTTPPATAAPPPPPPAATPAPTRAANPARAPSPRPPALCAVNMALPAGAMPVSPATSVLVFLAGRADGFAAADVRATLAGGAPAAVAAPLPHAGGHLIQIAAPSNYSGVVTVSLQPGSGGGGGGDDRAVAPLRVRVGGAAPVAVAVVAPAAVW